jgi:hypothetical protein
MSKRRQTPVEKSSGWRNIVIYWISNSDNLAELSSFRGCTFWIGMARELTVFGGFIDR